MHFVQLSMLTFHTHMYRRSGSSSRKYIWFYYIHLYCICIHVLCYDG